MPVDLHMTQTGRLCKLAIGGGESLEAMALVRDIAESVQNFPRLLRRELGPAVLSPMPPALDQRVDADASDVHKAYLVESRPGLVERVVLFLAILVQATRRAVGYTNQLFDFLLFWLGYAAQAQALCKNEDSVIPAVRAARLLEVEVLLLPEMTEVFLSAPPGDWETQGSLLE